MCSKTEADLAAKLQVNPWLHILRVMTSYQTETFRLINGLIRELVHVNANLVKVTNFPSKLLSIF